MARQDDPSICGEILLFRRIPPSGGHVQWEANGEPTPASQNFRDKANELSVHMAPETTPDAVLAGHDDFGLVQFTAQDVREVFKESNAEIIICRDDEDPANGHVLICGKITNGMARRLRGKVRWVERRWPKRIDS
jgi:hypothetical protein